MRARTMTGVTASVADDGHEQNRNDSEDEDTADVDEVCDAQRQKWVLQNFIIPLKACYNCPVIHIYSGCILDTVHTSRH